MLRIMASWVPGLPEDWVRCAASEPKASMKKWQDSTNNSSNSELFLWQTTVSTLPCQASNGFLHFGTSCPTNMPPRRHGRKHMRGKLGAKSPDTSVQFTWKLECCTQLSTEGHYCCNRGTCHGCSRDEQKQASTKLVAPRRTYEARKPTSMLIS